MRFFFPDSQDQVSPSFDFRTEEYSPFRVRQRDDRYAHEVLDPPPYDGILVSKAIVDGSTRGAGKYSEAQRSRLYRYGVRDFFRLPVDAHTLGDCGAFNYVNEPEPPYSVTEVADFYESIGFAAGVSVDHVVLAYDRRLDLEHGHEEWQERRRISLRYAQTFLDECIRRGEPFVPVGAAQGWDPTSYTDSVRQLQDMGYKRIALGGMVPLKTADILASLAAIDEVRNVDVELHLLGITRLESMSDFAQYGVTSFDSTAPFRQAFMDDKNNYHVSNGEHYVAIRVPQVDANPTVKRRVLAGELDQRTLVSAERQCLRALRAVGEDVKHTDETLAALTEYENLLGVKRSYLEQYERTLRNRPWEKCSCSLCRKHGIQIAIFRGTERNKSRGFHNLSVLCSQVRQLPQKTKEAA
ncbi:tRNA-guanine transglycosylase DpdA [Geodermatophilus sp. FMUSA9-8]|uniref:tRNA-guanine transglycosylase DpdA n=1 Tax=Geodermatophilus sp. FMUSA9-8 TaxID=3120155 RepID=UPI00300A7556